MVAYFALCDLIWCLLLLVGVCYGLFWWLDTSTCGFAVWLFVSWWAIVLIVVLLVLFVAGWNLLVCCFGCLVLCLVLLAVLLYSFVARFIDDCWFMGLLLVGTADTC